MNDSQRLRAFHRRQRPDFLGPFESLLFARFDNVVADPGSGGSTFRTDTIGGVEYPGTKIVVGANNADDGFVSSANPMPVTGTLAEVTTVATVSAVTTVSTVATVGAVTSITNPVAVTQSGSWSVTADTELPSAGALADNMSNPTTPLIGGCVLVWDGSNWDRAPGNSADGLLVNLGANNDVTVTSSALPSGAATSAKQDTVIGHLDGVETVLGTIDADTSALAGCVGGTEVQVDVVSSALPSGAATAANQATANTSLAAIDTSTGRLAGKYLDFDTGAGTDSVVAVGLLVPGSGGAAIGGTASAPIRTDPTGTTTQPVSAASLPLPSNAAAETGGNLAAAATSLGVIDDWDESDRAKVNLIVGQAGVAAGVGSVSATTQRTTLASDDPAVALLGTIDADTSGLFACISNNRVQVDVVSSALPTGAATAANQDTGNTSLASIDTFAGRIAGKYLDFDTGAGTDSVVAVGLLLPASGGAAIGGTSSNPFRTDPTGSTTQPVSAASLPLPTNAAAETGGNLAAAATSLAVIDDWDESDRAKANIIVGQAGISAGAGSIAANTPRVTHASDDPAVAALTTIDADTGNIATAASAIQTAVEAMDDWDESNRAKVNPIAGQAGVAAGAGAVDALTQRTTLASDDPAVALLGTIDADTGNAVTALQVIDDWDESDRAKVNPIAGQAGVQGGSGTVTALTQRVVLATDVAFPTGTNAIGRVGHDISGIAHGVKTVSSAGADEVLVGSSTPCKLVSIQAQTDNTGLIAVGGSGVDATEATGTGRLLEPGDSLDFPIDNLNKVYIDATVSGDGVRYTYWT